MLEIKFETVNVNFLMDFVREGSERTRLITRFYTLLLTNNNNGYKEVQDYENIRFLQEYCFNNNEEIL